MKIKKIVTSHFKNAPDMELYLDKINVLTGENGKGKSSMLHALRYALNGKLPEDPIRHGTDSVSVKAVLDDGQNTKATDQNSRRTDGKIANLMYVERA